MVVIVLDESTKSSLLKKKKKQQKYQPAEAAARRSPPVGARGTFEISARSTYSPCTLVFLITCQPTSPITPAFLPCSLFPWSSSSNVLTAFLPETLLSCIFRPALSAFTAWEVFTCVSCEARSKVPTTHISNVVSCPPPLLPL